MSAQEHSAMSGGKEFKPLKFKLGKPGDILKGTIVSKEWKEPNQGDPYWELDIQVQLCQFHDLKADEAGNYVAVEQVTEVPAGDTIKTYGGRKELDELIKNSNVGEIIGIQFLEYQKGKGAKPFKKVLCKNFGKDPEYKDTVTAAKEILGGEEVPAEATDKVEGVNF